MNMSFYTGAVGAFQQQQRMNVQANNIANVNNYGYKAERATFHHLMYGNVVGIDNEDLPRGTGTKMVKASVDYTTNGYADTGRTFDFAIVGDGFFAIQDPEGNVSYTRMGNFSLDEEGYLCFPGVGRVLDPRGQTIQLNTDKLAVDEQGVISTEDGAYLGQLGVYTFPDMEQVEYDARGMFTGEGAQAAAAPTVYWKYLERSNVNMIRQMTEMLTCQRSLQSAAQVTKMYDELMSHTSSDIGRV